MWYEDLMNDGERADLEAELKMDAFWKKLEDYWYEYRPHNIDRDFEELNSYELEQVKRNYAAFMEEQYNPEMFYATGGR